MNRRETKLLRSDAPIRAQHRSNARILCADNKFIRKILNLCSQIVILNHGSCANPVVIAGVADQVPMISSESFLFLAHQIAWTWPIEWLVSQALATVAVIAQTIQLNTIWVSRIGNLSKSAWFHRKTHKNAGAFISHADDLWCREIHITVGEVLGHWNECILRCLWGCETVEQPRVGVRSGVDNTP